MNKRTDINFIKSYCENYGYELLTTDYKNQKQKLDLRCPKSHVYSVTFNNFKRGDRCTTCSGKGNGFSKLDVQEWLSDRNCELITTEYQNQKQLLDYLCKCGNPMKNTMQRLRSFSKDPYCLECRRKDAKKQRLDDANELLSKIWF
jgi:hypothetical protein